MKKPRSGRAVRAIAPVSPVPLVVEFLLDETGSMDRFLSPTIGGYNDWLEEQRKGDGLCLLTMTKFEGRNFKTPYTDVDVKFAPDLTPHTYIPSQGGGTPLRDAILQRLCALRQRLRSWDIKPNVLFVVMTDGEDNQSLVGEDAIRTQMSMALAEGWTVAFMGAHDRATQDGIRLGFPSGNVKCFSGAKMREAFGELSKATTAFRSSRAADWVDPYHRKVHTNANFFDGR